MPFDERIQRILRKLAEVRERRIETFGADHHRYVLTPPLSEEAVRAFERERGVVLPADFRAFVTQAGESGAGPCYGLLPLARWNDALRGDEKVPDWLSRPCLFAPDTPRGDGAYEAAVGDAVEPFQGAIAIVDQGCTYYAMLIVSGPHAGRVMYINLDGGVPYFVENPDFLSWYERWLDELLWGHRHVWFGMGMPGDEATLAAAARQATSPRRLDALHAMHRLPGVTESTAAIVATRLCDDDRAVRATALQLVAKHKIGGLDLHVRRALDDAQAPVRLAALVALIALDATWRDDARHLLRDPDPEVAARALRELAKAGAIGVEEVLPLLDAASPILAATALDTLRTLPSERAVAALLPRARARSEPDALLALLGQVRGGAATPAQLDEALDVVIARLLGTTRGFTAIVYGLGAFVKTHPRALAALLDATRHENAFVRYEAAAVLGDVAGEEAIPALAALCADTTMPREDSRSTAWSVGENARRAIKKIRQRKGIAR